VMLTAHGVGCRVEAIAASAKGRCRRPGRLPLRPLPRRWPRARSPRRGRARAAAHRIGIVEHVARQRLAARPGEGPEGRRQPDLAQFFFRLLPHRHRLVGEMQADLRHQRHRQQGRVGADEGGRSLACAASAARGVMQAAHAAYDLPFLLGDRLHRQARVLDQHHVGEPRLELDVVERHRPRQVLARRGCRRIPSAGRRSSDRGALRPRPPRCRRSRAHRPSDRRSRGRPPSWPACCCAPDSCAPRPNARRPRPLAFCWSHDQVSGSDLNSQ
jgi:hypothetical protein